MRKNLAKHTAKKLPLAKRVLALCFALIFVCSCLLPAFANGTGAELETPDTEVVEAADPGAEPEPMDLYDEPAAVADEPEALDDDFAMDDEPAAMDDQVEKPVVDGEPAAMDDQVEKPVVDDEPAAMDDQVEKPVVDDEPAAMDNEVEKPVEGGEPPVADDTPAKEGATKTTTDASGNIVYEYDTSGTTFPDDDTAALPEGDQMQVDAAFSIPTNIYHFWLKKMSSYDLADIADAAKTAEMTVEQYLAMYGTEKGCYHIMTAADGANLKDYQFANPTSNDDPEGNSRTFAGWYYTDDLGDEQKFVFDEHLYVSEGTTVEVYAKWKELEPEVKKVDFGDKEVSFKVEDAPALTVSKLSESKASELGEKVLDEIDWDEYNVIYMFDLSPKDRDGIAIESPKKVTITGLGVESAADVKVFHQGSGFEEIPVEVSADGALTFTPNSFSPFAIAVADNGVTSNEVSYLSLASEDLGVADEYADEYGVATMSLSNGATFTIEPGATVTVTGSSSSWHSSSWNSSNWKDRWSSDNSQIVIRGTSDDQQTITIKDNSNVEGTTATITHQYWAYSEWSWRYYQTSEQFYVTTKKWTDSYEGNAAIYFLKVPTGGKQMSNNSDNWLPGAGESEMLGTINVGKHGTYPAAVWSQSDDTYQKNVVTTRNQNVTDYITGSNDSGLEWDATNGYFVVKRSSSWFNYIWTQASTQTAYQGMLTNKDDVIAIHLTPCKISRANGGTYPYHIDCELTIVNKKTYDAKFWERDPDTVDEWNLVDDGTYKQDENVPLTTERIIGDKKVGKDGVNYILVGWYLEDQTSGKYDANSSRLLESNEWSYEPTEADLENGVVNFYALWVPETQRGIKITKQVTGWFGDHEKEFEFTVVDKNGNLKKSFTLTSGRSQVIDDFLVQAGDTVKITEAGAEDYETTAQIYAPGGTELLNQAFDTSTTPKSITITITKEMIDGLNEIEIVVTNHREGEIDNGVLLDTLPYILILVVVVGGGVLLFLRKRKNDDDE